MKVLLANPRGFCAGVDRAVKIVEMALEAFGPPVYVRREIVHNSHVVRELREKGAVFVEELGEAPDGARAVFSAHGGAPSVFREAEARGLRVIDATCPLVTKVHLEVHRFVKQGYHILLIGHDGHDEVEGTIGCAPDRIILIEDERQAREKPVPPHDKLLILMQTTLGVDDTAGIVAALQERFPDAELPPTEDICYATQNRQDAVKEMCARGVGLLLVVGSHNSSNAARLVEVARTHGVSGFLIDGANDIDEQWVRGVATIGVTAGASTPEPVIQNVLDRLKALGAESVKPCITVEENTVFQLPPGLKQAVDALAASASAKAPSNASAGASAKGKA